MKIVKIGSSPFSRITYFIGQTVVDNGQTIHCIPILYGFISEITYESPTSNLIVDPHDWVYHPTTSIDLSFPGLARVSLQMGVGGMV